MKKKKLEAKLSETEKKLVKTRSKLKEMKAALETREAEEGGTQMPEMLSSSPTAEVLSPQKTVRTKSRKT